MASTPEGLRLTNEHHAAQVKLTATMVAQLRLAWPLLDPLNLDATAPGWALLAEQILADQHARSAALALEYLPTYRAAEIGTLEGVPLLTVPALPPAATTSLMVAGPVKVKQGVSAGLSLDAATSAAFDAVASASALHVQSGARGLEQEFTRRDRRALGYWRVTSGSPCYFCAMLASRGAVYSKNSFRNVRVHGHCHCQMESLYTKQGQWSGKRSQWADLYDEVAQRVPPGGDTVNAFRRAYNQLEGNTKRSRFADARAAASASSKPLAIPDVTQMDLAKSLERKAQAAWQAGDSAEMTRLQSEASAIRRKAYNEAGIGLDSKAA